MSIAILSAARIHQCPSPTEFFSECVLLKNLQAHVAVRSVEWADGGDEICQICHLFAKIRVKETHEICGEQGTEVTSIL